MTTGGGSRNGRAEFTPRAEVTQRTLVSVAAGDAAPAALLPLPLGDDAPAWQPPEPPPYMPATFAAVTIQRDDDLASIFGKIDAADSPRVALVAPRGNRELGRKLAMRRLQRHLDLTGKDLILVTRSRLLRVRGREEGVPSVTHLKRVDFDRRRSGLQLGWLTLRLPTLGALAAVAVFVAAVAAGAVVLFWYVPRASVTVFVPTQTIGETIDIVVDSKAGSVDLAKGVVPGRRREITITRTLPGPATGVAYAPLEHAAVGLVFVNRTNRPVTITKGTVATSNTGVQFTIANDVNLTARTGATGEAIALSQRPGTVGNVPPNSVRGLEPALAELATVNNPAAGEKGTDLTLQVVSDNDVGFISRLAMPYLIDAAKKEMLLQFAESETVFSDSGRAEILDTTPVPPVGQVARYTEVTFTGRASMLTASDADLNSLYVDRLRPKAGADKMLLEDQFRSTIDRAGTLDSTFDRLTISPRVTVQLAPFIDPDALRQALRGKSRSGVEREVRRLLGAAEAGPAAPPPAVRLARWAPWLPKRADRIEVAFKPAP